MKPDPRDPIAYHMLFAHRKSGKRFQPNTGCGTLILLAAIAIVVCVGLLLR